MTDGWLWQAPIWAFGGVLLLRFTSAPFLLWREKDAPLREMQALLLTSCELAHFTVRYVVTLSGCVQRGEKVDIDDSVFGVCIDSINDAIRTGVPHPLLEKFVDIKYTINRAKEVIVKGQPAEIGSHLGLRAQHNLDAIDLYISRMPD